MMLAIRYYSLEETAGANKFSNVSWSLDFNSFSGKKKCCISLGGFWVSDKTLTLLTLESEE